MGSQLITAKHTETWELSEVDNLKYQSLSRKCKVCVFGVCVCVLKWEKGQTVLSTIMGLTGSTGVGAGRSGGSSE